MSTKKIDALYLQGKEQEDSFAFYWTNLRPLLLKYAQTIGRSTQRQVELHLLEEMVNDLLMAIGEFRGASKFSTWAYVRFRRRFIDEYRYQSRNIGESLDTLQEEWESRQTEEAEYFTDPFTKSMAPSQEQDSILEDFQNRLPERQQFVLEAHVSGHTFQEIGDSLGVTMQRAEQIWKQVLTAAERYREGS